MMYFFHSFPASSEEASPQEAQERPHQGSDQLVNYLQEKPEQPDQKLSGQVRIILQVLTELSFQFK